MAAILMTGCGGGASGGSGTEPEGSLSFSVQWDRQTASGGDITRAGVDDCADVDTVSAAVYDNAGGLLQTGGPWACSDGQGTIAQVPAERYVAVAVAGHSTTGATLYRGQSTEFFFLPGGGVVDAGLIVAPAFGATLVSPADGATVPTIGLTLAWNAVSGAGHYLVQVADSSTFDDASILQTLTVDASANPTGHPDTAGMNVDVAYFWRVQVVDEAGNTSEPSAFRYFFADPNLLLVIINSPPDGTTFQLGETVAFDATVTAPDGADLTSADLTEILWTSTVDNSFSGALAFSTSGLYGGDQTITLNVQDAAGRNGAASVNVLVNRPPTAQIQAPLDGFDYYPFGDVSTVACEGAGTDPEGGALTFQWQLFAPGDSVNPILTGSGINFSIDNTYFLDANSLIVTGAYTLALRVTDPDGGSSSASSIINVNNG